MAFYKLCFLNHKRKKKKKKNKEQVRGEASNANGNIKRSELNKESGFR